MAAIASMRLVAYLERVDRPIDVGLARADNLLKPLEYYANIMAKDKAVFDGFMRKYGYNVARKFSAHTSAWTDQPPGES